MLTHYKYIFHVISAIKSDLGTAFHFLFAQLAQFIIIDVVFSLTPQKTDQLRERNFKLSQYSEKYLGWVFFFCK